MADIPSHGLEGFIMPAPAIKTDSPFWRLPATVLLEQLAASPDGLSSAEAALRLTRFGPNLIHGERKRALILQFLAKFKNPLVIILLTASALSAFTGDATSFFIIGTIVLIRYLGDGINDAPSLHSADVGISVDSAVDVAKAAADMILLEQDLGVLHAGVLEGRRTFGNIMKYIMMGTSSNFGNMFSMAGASLILPFLPMLPVQILLNNLLYDVSELPIPLDRVDDDYLSHPRHWDMKFIRNFMLVIGPVSSVFDFLTFYVMLAVFHAGEALFHTGWFIESMATQVLVIFIIRTRRNPFKSRPNPWLIACSLMVVAVAALLPFTSAGVYLGFVAPPVFFFLILTAMLLAYLLAVELMKRWFFRRFAAE
jgi:Mg2+-importing ATPase